MSTFIHDLRYGLRMLRRNPGFTLVALVALALGIGANTALFSVVYGVLLRPLPYPGQEQLVMLWESDPEHGIEQELVTPADFAEWQTQCRSFDEMAFWTGQTDFNLVTGDGMEKVRATYASSGLFKTLRIQPQLGRGFLEEEDRRQGPLTAVISHHL